MAATLPCLFLSQVHQVSGRVVPLSVAKEVSAADLVASYVVDGLLKADAIRGSPAVSVQVTNTGLGIDLSIFALEVPLLWAKVAGYAQPDEQRSLIAVIPQSFKGQLAWMVDVQGGASIMYKVLNAMGAAGAVRHDFHDIYRKTGMLSHTGGFASVCIYQAHRCCHTLVAVKVPSMNKAAEDLDMIRNEAKCLAQVPPHVNVISFLGIFLEQGASQETSLARLVMEYCSRGDLHGLVTSGGVLSETDALYVMQGIFSALKHLHKHGVIHRDVKPENVLLREHGEVALCDFGIAACCDDLLELSQCRGTPGFAAPEMILRKLGTPRIDIFAAGALMFFALNGYHLFKAQDIHETLKNTVCCKFHIHKHPALEHLSSANKQFLHLLLRKAAAERPSAEEALLHVQSCIMDAGLLPSSRVWTSSNGKDIYNTSRTSTAVPERDKSPQTQSSEKIALSASTEERSSTSLQVAAAVDQAISKSDPPIEDWYFQERPVNQTSGSSVVADDIAYHYSHDSGTTIDDSHAQEGGGKDKSSTEVQKDVAALEQSTEKAGTSIKDPTSQQKRVAMGLLPCPPRTPQRTFQRRICPESRQVLP